MKKIISKVLFLAGCVCILLFLFFFLVGAEVKQKMNLATTYVAAHDIPPRTEIKEEDLVEIQVPSAYLLDNTYNKPEDMIGKYTEIQGMIPAGSLFYKHMLYDASSLPDNPVLQLKKGQTIYALNGDSTALSSLTAGERADVYIEIERNGDVPLTGCLLENVRIAALKGRQGLDLSRKESDKVPGEADLAVNREDLALLTLGESVGKLRLFAASSPYDTSKEAQLKTDSPAVRYLQQLQKNDQENKE